MMKSFILATISIAYILSISSIADAKVPKINKRVNQDLACQNPVDSNPQYNQLAKDNIDLKKDMKIICQLINKKYTGYNKFELIEDNILNSNATTAHTKAVEIKSMKLVSYHRSNSEKKAGINVDISFILREYSWDRAKDKDKWNVTSTKHLIDRLSFVEKNGKWWMIGRENEKV